MQASAGHLRSKEELICEEMLISSYSDGAQLARRMAFGVSEQPKNLTSSWRQDAVKVGLVQ